MSVRTDRQEEGFCSPKFPAFMSSFFQMSVRIDGQEEGFCSPKFRCTEIFANENANYWRLSDVDALVNTTVP